MAPACFPFRKQRTRHETILLGLIRRTGGPGHQTYEQVDGSTTSRDSAVITLNGREPAAIKAW
ncbi:MAG: hypothetical protein A4E19_13905 [Nitrospira sp. SG-bin1]|nr:MAG: hypothetical protein A4E19_13905 [Nitrospira sp. SG-bin1]